VAIVEAEDRFFTADHHYDEVAISSLDAHRTEHLALLCFLGRLMQGVIQLAEILSDSRRCIASDCDS